jgi:hypothetical protein
VSGRAKTEPAILVERRVEGEGPRLSVTCPTCDVTSIVKVSHYRDHWTPAHARVLAYATAMTPCLKCSGRLACRAVGIAADDDLIPQN